MDSVDFLPPAFEKKIVDPAAGNTLVAAVNKLPRPLVFTNGVFDVLHRGHVTYLAQARAQGASLIVALNSDASTRRLGKGDDRPIHALPDRAAVIASLEAVNAVTWFEDDTPLALIRLLRPDVLIKGGDWKAGDIVGADDVRAAGGKVYSIPFLHQKSTSALLAAIRYDTKK